MSSTDTQIVPVPFKAGINRETTEFTTDGAWYDGNRDKIFAATDEDPEGAHEKFVRLAKLIHGLRLEKLILDCSENQHYPDFKISNAAGFNKNGNIPPTFLVISKCKSITTSLGDYRI